MKGWAQRVVIFAMTAFVVSTVAGLGGFDVLSTHGGWLVVGLISTAIMGMGEA